MVDGMNVQATCLNSSEEDVDCRCVQACNGALLPAAFLITNIDTCSNFWSTLATPLGTQKELPFLSHDFNMGLWEPASVPS